MSTIRIVIELEGGLVRNCYSPDWPDAEVIVVDYDLEGIEDDRYASQTSPVDDWATVHPTTAAVVQGVADENYLTVGQLKELMDNEDGPRW